LPSFAQPGLASVATRSVPAALGFAPWAPLKETPVKVMKPPFQ
jgi:hypothetical protein